MKFLNAFKKYASQAAKEVGSAAKTARTVAKEVKNVAKVTAEEVKSAAKNVGSSTKDIVKEAGENIKKNVRHATGKNTERVVNEEAQSATQNIAKKKFVSPQVTNVPSEDLPEELRRYLSEGTADVEEIIQRMREKKAQSATQNVTKKKFVSPQVTKVKEEELSKEAKEQIKNIRKQYQDGQYSFGKAAAGVGTMMAGAMLIKSMNENKGRQTPSQLYNQEPRY